MAMTLVSTVTVGAGGAANIEWTNIPQTGKDLLIVTSIRTNATGGNLFDSPLVDFNGLSTNQTSLYAIGGIGTDGTGLLNGTETRFAVIFGGQANDTTSNTFANGSFYTANYAGSSTKVSSSDGVIENNNPSAGLGINASRWNSTAAITSIRLTSSRSATLLQDSTASLYIIS